MFKLNPQIRIELTDAETASGGGREPCLSAAVDNHSQNHYAVLGVQRSATLDDNKAIHPFAFTGRFCCIHCWVVGSLGVCFFSIMTQMTRRMEKEETE
ncbi:hypothetical protein Nepgr_010079 [Nepenthes gracilis]|uniref:Uncharacterized protein n=1 Tax=Nepenthes gracilis TaxID=150966 RepID=A0AAD3SCP5_NEPGR|nr:hypothetical protein Nepgr_010079 [Nepenthes gracilis]